MALLALMAAMITMSRTRPLVVTTVVAGVSLALFAVAVFDAAIGSHQAPVGLAERLVIGADLAWLALAARVTA